MKTYKNTLVLLVLTACSSTLFGQSVVNFYEKGWHLEDPASQSVQGINLEKTYTELLKQKNPKKKIIVAVIDSGIDTAHEDLKPVLWRNEKEIPGNGIDDDKNGYIDDIYGWNFIGGKNGDVEKVTKMEFLTE